MTECFRHYLQSRRHLLIENKRLASAKSSKRPRAAAPSAEVGLSLQELVVPVVTVRVETARSEGAPARRVRVSGVPSVLTTRTLGVKLALDVEGLFETGEPI